MIETIEASRYRDKNFVEPDQSYDVSSQYLSVPISLYHVFSTTFPLQYIFSILSQHNKWYVV